MRLRFAGMVLVAVFFAMPVAAKGEFIYKSSNKLDFIKVDEAKKAEKEGGLKHPYTFGDEQIRAILRSLHFNKKILLLKDVENRQLFDEQNVEFLAPYLKEAFQKAGAEQAVVVSYFTRDSKFLIQNDRLSIFRAYIKEDGLHLRFTKLYAKLLGDRVTQGALRAAGEAHGMRVSLELQPGQNRISVKPEELVFDLNYYGPEGRPVGEKKSKKDAKAEKAVEKTVKAKESEDNAKSIRVRLKELEQLKKDELITDKEYQKKRQDLIKQL